MVKCGIPFMSKDSFGGTPVPLGLTALSGVSALPPNHPGSSWCWSEDTTPVGVKVTPLRTHSTLPGHP